jgi:glycosyltransferase involved in cell wall biosynthesis
LKTCDFKKKTRVLFVIGSMDIGGAEKQLTILADRIRGYGYSCSVFSLQSDGVLVDILREKRIPIHSGGLKKGDLRRAPWKLVRAQWRMMSVIRAEKPDVLHAFLPLATFMGSFAGRMQRVPLIVTSRRALSSHQERIPLLKPFDRLADRLSHRVTVNSKAVWNDAVKRNNTEPSKLVLIYNGVDPVPIQKALSSRDKIRQSLGIEAHEKVIISIANLIPYKGHSDLFRALKLVAREIPNVRLLLLGEDRGIKDRLERLAYDLGISSFIQYLGRKDDIAPFLAASDISIVASHEEGFSNVILESMAAGLPVVATRVGGNPEAVVDGVTGWIVEPRQPGVMAHRITDLLRNPRKAGEWGLKGKERVMELFTVERMVIRHLDLYETSSLSRTDCC